MILKLDMSKTYDRVEWSFLTNIMKKIGLCEAWINLSFNYVSKVSYSILTNGEPKGSIIPTRGIRQGDHLSSYLFLLCSEGLNKMLQQVAKKILFEVILCVKMALGLLTSYLQMTVCYFVEQD